MSRDKLIIAGVVVLGILGALVYKQAKNDEAIGAPPMASTAAELPTLSAPEDVDKLELTNGDKPTIVLERVPDPKAEANAAATQWVMKKPVASEVTQQVVKDLLANLKDLKADSKVNLKLDDDVRKDKQLDAAHAVRVVAYKDGTKKVDESFGKSGAAGQLVVVADKPEAVYAAKGYSSYLYTKEAKDFREKTIFKYDDANVIDATITNSHGTFAFKKDGDKWAGTLNKRPIEHFDPEKVKDFVRVYKALNADDFGDGKSFAEAGLDKPEATVLLHTKGDDAKTYELLVGKQATASNHYAKKPDDELVFQITGYVTDWVTSDASKFQTTGDAGLGAPPAGKPKLDLNKK
jgi:Domain of unknown function (DUF4340)